MLIVITMCQHEKASDKSERQAGLAEKNLKTAVWRVGHWSAYRGRPNPALTAALSSRCPLLTQLPHLRILKNAKFPLNGLTVEIMIILCLLLQQTKYWTIYSTYIVHLNCRLEYFVSSFSKVSANLFCRTPTVWFQRGVESALTFQ